MAPNRTKKEEENVEKVVEIKSSNWADIIHGKSKEEKQAEANGFFLDFGDGDKQKKRKIKEKRK